MLSVVPVLGLELQESTVADLEYFNALFAVYIFLLVVEELCWAEYRSEPVKCDVQYCLNHKYTVLDTVTTSSTQYSKTYGGAFNDSKNFY